MIFDSSRPGRVSLLNTIWKAFDQIDDERARATGNAAAKDGLIGTSDLQLTVQDSAVAPQVREAARALLTDRSLFNAVDGAQTSGQLDGLINQADLVRAIGSFQADLGNDPRAVQPEPAILVQTDYFGGTVQGTNFSAFDRVEVYLRDPQEPVSSTVITEGRFTLALKSYNQSGRVGEPINVVGIRADGSRETLYQSDSVPSYSPEAWRRRMYDVNQAAIAQMDRAEERRKAWFCAWRKETTLSIFSGPLLQGTTYPRPPSMYPPASWEPGDSVHPPYGVHRKPAPPRTVDARVQAMLDAYNAPDIFSSGGTNADLLGAPLNEQSDVNGRVVQYFEYGRLEWDRATNVSRIFLEGLPLQGGMDPFQRYF
jgi:hypothetical protein